MFLEQRLANPKQAHSFTGLFWIASVRYGGSPPSPPPPPPPPDYAAANRAGVLADVQSLGSRKAIENAARFGGRVLAYGVQQKDEDRLKDGIREEKYRVQVGTRSEAVRRSGSRRGGSGNTILRNVPVYEERTRYLDSGGNEVAKDNAFAKRATYYQIFDEDGKRLKKPIEVSESEAVLDFKGVSDIDSAKAAAQFQREQADINAGAQLELAKKYSGEFVSAAKKQLRELDPTAYDLREQIGKSLAEELSAGQRLTPEEERQVTQSVRGAQAARGNLYGGAPIAQEAIARYGAGVQRQQQRVANVQSYLGLNPIVAQAGGLSALQQGSVPMSQTPIPQGLNINPNAGQLGTQFALGVFDNQTRQYGAQLDYMASTYATQQQFGSPLSYLNALNPTRMFSIGF